MYQIRCDESVLFDPRDEELVLLNPKCKLEVNTVGEGSFTILSNHPHYDKLKKLRSIFEIRQDDQPIFRGRMTNNSRDFYNCLSVDLEGVLAFTNDSIVPPFVFPDAFPDATRASNMAEYFLRWLIEEVHNNQVEPWQRLYVGNVTVRDPNNFISRSSESYLSTWEVLKTRLFESSLGGYLCIRYEEDGNYIDYLESFEQTNGQGITFSENLLDLNNESDASSTYSAILPLGADTDGVRLTLERLDDGNLSDDLVKSSKFIYSNSAKDDYGWICVPPEEATWDDVTDVENLKTKAMEYLSGTAVLFSSTITIKAVDLSFTDDQIQSFRIYKNILVNSPVHGVVNASYPLTQLDIDIMNPQNTIITIGDTVRTLVDVNSAKQASSIVKVEQVAHKVTTKGEHIQEQVTIIDGNTKDLRSQVNALAKELNDIADHITQTGTIDIWTVRMWSSGTVECWGSIASEDVTDVLTYPVTFVGDPCVQITENSGKTHYYVIGTMEIESGESTNQ